MNANNYADILIFNPALANNKSAFEKSQQYPGKLSLYLFGILTIDNDFVSVNRAGKP
ncbi:MAG TPA: hypothetical protein VI548_13120 [Chitinophagaceae bacterium]|nr:hypothetical protein [Chitinophagaceae bacterium]